MSKFQEIKDSLASKCLKFSDFFDSDVEIFDYSFIDNRILIIYKLPEDDHFFREWYCFWYENGNRKNEYYTKNGDKEGKEYSWHENGKLICEYNYKNGIMDEKQYRWYKDGKLAYENNYKNGRKDGKQYGWFNDGKLHFEESYKNGIKDGKQSIYYPNELKEYDDNWEDGKRHGICRVWKVTGDLLFEVKFDKGELVK